MRETENELKIPWKNTQVRRSPRGEGGAIWPLLQDDPAWRSSHFSSLPGSTLLVPIYMFKVCPTPAGVEAWGPLLRHLPSGPRILDYI